MTKDDTQMTRSSICKHTCIVRSNIRVDEQKQRKELQLTSSTHVYVSFCGLVDSPDDIE
jgi:hypothetical protein